MVVKEATMSRKIEIPNNLIVTTWEVKDCTFNSMCYCSLNQPLTTIDKCMHYGYVDDLGLHCARPNSLDFIELIKVE